MIILAIDPGSEKSAWVAYDSEKKIPINFGIEENTIISECLSTPRKYCEQFGIADFFAIEMIASYGMPVGKSVFETCVWIGRFIHAWGSKGYKKIYRIDVKMHLCKNTRAKDSNIRQAIIDRYQASGGGKTPQIGTKAQPGPLYGVSKDVWSALAVAITAAEIYIKRLKGE